MKIDKKHSAYEFSLVIPVYNELPNLPTLFKRLQKAQSEWPKPYQIIFVNDGSSDASLALLKKHKKGLRNIKIIDLTRNFGHQAALLAGMREASGLLIGCIDADLQDPPELLIKMIRQMKSSQAEVIFGVRKKRKEDPLKVFCYWLAYRLLKKILKINMPLDSGDFCVMKKQVVDILVKYHDQNLFLRGLRAWAGFRQEAFYYERAAREFGDSKYSYFDLISLALNGIVGFTILPVIFLGALGVFGILISLIYFVFIALCFLFSFKAPAGFFSVMASLLLFSSIQLCAFGIVGLYVFKNYEETRKRPLFLIKKIY